MLTRALRPSAPAREQALLSCGAAATTAALAYAGIHKLGLVPGLLVPLALLLAVVLLMRPLFAVMGVLVLTVLAEGSNFGLLASSAKLYEASYKDFSLVDGLVALAIMSVALDLLRKRRRPRVPRALVLPFVVLALAMAAGVITGHAAGASTRFAITSEAALGYLLLLPLAVANLDLGRRQIARLLAGGVLLATVKAILGLVEIAAHLGPSIEGVAELTYYEPTANWLIMGAILTIFALVLARRRTPRWMLLASPLLIACLVLSYRRSFWIAAVLALLLVLLLGTTPVGRRLIIPSALAIALAVWLLGSVDFQSQLPIVKRASSLSPSKLQSNAQDRYRLDERANVIAEIERHPISGLGMTIPWAPIAQTLPLESESGRDYVHFAALWYWLKLGILGLFAYVAVMAGSILLAWKAWRASPEPLLRAFALASLCAFCGLLVIDTTASFTGVDPRFTILFATQLGLLALIRRTAPASASAR
ncbi:MAG TPA: O-antigen ligase family protein [Solirubrobacteraceae bacterium]|nr:O-antigen ligase family protein [Solirubrobacteraceae bacterium]